MARLALGYHEDLGCLEEAELCNLVFYLRIYADGPTLITPQHSP